MSILTTTPNKKMSKPHHSMPVILETDEFENWFATEGREEIDYMIQPVNDDWIELRKEG